MVEKGRIESTLETAWEDRGLKEPTSACDSNYIDDLTMFMAWHNWCLHEQNRVLSQILHNQYQKITNLQNDTDQQLRNTTTFNNVLRNESTRRGKYLRNIDSINYTFSTAVCWIQLQDVTFIWTVELSH